MAATETTSRVLEGTGVSPGIAIGPLVHMGAPIADLPGPVSSGVPDIELGRAQRALDEVARDLEQRRDRGPRGTPSPSSTPCRCWRGIRR